MAEDTRKDILEEHRRIRLVLGRADAAVQDSQVGTAWAEELVEILAELSDLLKEHFSGEAESSFFRKVQENAPRLSSKIHRLAMEHSVIVKAFAESAELAKDLDVGDAIRIEALRTKVQLSLAMLQRHEAEENELIMEAYWEDLGGGD